ncbi:MAG: chlorophyll synthesis pathway protein BchC, partial [Betaproteobacteria bacterium]|nr:chlorophyll synthesis pathway protein BchC [Betaproteobacteria bacterium]
AVAGMVRDGSLSLDGLITDEFSPAQATQAYEKAFEDPNALKVVLNWGSLQ